MSSIRATAVITNSSESDVRVSNIACETVFIKDPESGKLFPLSIGTLITKEEELTVYATTNDRVFIAFEGKKHDEKAHKDITVYYKLAFTCPKSSHNSATGYGDCGLAHYEETGTPVEFTYFLSKSDNADWDNGSKYGGNFPDYGDCS